MKVGDFVLKITGDRDVGKRGIIVKIYNDKAMTGGYLVIDVLVNGTIRCWPAHHVKLIYECQHAVVHTFVTNH